MGPARPGAASIHIGRNRTVSEWKVIYRDNLDHDRISPSVSSKEAALAQARNLHRERRAEIYKIEGPAGGIVPKDEVMRWVSAHRWRPRLAAR